MRRRTISALVLAGGGFAATSALWQSDQLSAPYGWLAAFATWIGAPLGCLALILIHALTGGEWGYAIRPQLNAGARALPLLPLFLLPLVFAAREIYPWLQPGARQLPNVFYLNEDAALTRLLFYLLVWFGLALLVGRRADDAEPEARTALIAPVGLILLALTSTFMSIDLLMSLDPRFSSSVFGLIRIADMGLLALSLCILSGLSRSALHRDALRQLGRILLALVILWAYLAFVELLIVWQSNLPNEASWYAPRLSGGWAVVAGLVAVIRFGLPFLFLLSPKFQSSVSMMRLVTILTIIGACANNLWLVGPQMNTNSVMLAASFTAALIGMSATTFAVTSQEKSNGERPRTRQT